MATPIEQITLAAIRCFKVLGIEKTTMEDVAKRAKISRPNLYRYISNRDDLVRLVVLHRAQSMRAEFHPHEGPWEEALLDIFVQYVKNALHDEIFRIIVEQAAPITSRLLIDDAAVGGALNDLLVPIIAKARQSGRLRTDISDEEIIRWIHYQVYCLSRDQKLVEAFDLEELGRKFVVGALLARHAQSESVTKRGTKKERVQAA